MIQKLIENRKYLSKLDETWPESGRVDRSGDAGRRPRAKFEPKRVRKTTKYQNKQKKGYHGLRNRSTASQKVQEIWNQMRTWMVGRGT